MKRTLLLLTVCSISGYLSAQSAKGAKVPPPPPLPPPALAELPPPPPAPPEAPVEEATFIPPAIVNEQGYSLSVHNNNGNTMIYAKKKGVTEKISLEKWNANKAYYEKKYGELPPPPPPPPAPKAPKAEE